MTIKLTAAQNRDLLLLHAAIEAVAVPTGLALARKGLVRVVYIDSQRRYSLTSAGVRAACAACAACANPTTHRPRRAT